MLYRLHDNISTGREVFPKGSISKLSRVSEEGVKTLLEKETISVVKSPPLSVIPGWDDRVEQLAELGYNYVADVLGEDLDELSGRTEISVDEFKSLNRYIGGYDD